MGTSNPFKGQSRDTPFVSPWVGMPTAPLPPVPEKPGEVPPAPPYQPATKPAAIADRFSGARGNFTRFASSGGSDRSSLGRSLSQYVSQSTGGAKNAARRMASSTATAAKLLGFLSQVRSEGVAEALDRFNLSALAGQPAEVIFTALANQICPQSGSLDDGIARDAFIETIADLAEAGLTDLGAITQSQMIIVFELYATRTIEARICNDIAMKLVTMPKTNAAARQVQRQLMEFIRNAVADALSNMGARMNALTSKATTALVEGVYQSAYSILETMASAEAEIQS